MDQSRRKGRMYRQACTVGDFLLALCIVLYDMGQQSVDGAGATTYFLLGLDKLRSDEGNRYFLFAADLPE